MGNTSSGPSTSASPLVPWVEDSYPTPEASPHSSTGATFEESGATGSSDGQRPFEERLALFNGVAVCNDGSTNAGVLRGQSPDPPRIAESTRQRRQSLSGQPSRRRRRRRTRMNRVLEERMARANFYRHCPKTGVHIFSKGTKLSLNKVGVYSHYFAP